MTLAKKKSKPAPQKRPKEEPIPEMARESLDYLMRQQLRGC